MRKLLFCSVTIIIFCCFSKGKTAQPAAFKIDVKELSYGICKTKQIETENSENSPTGHHIISEGFNLVKRTDTIPGELGLVFGIEFILSTKETTSIDIEKAWIFPSEMKDEKGKSFKEVRYSLELNTNEITFSTYKFENQYEIVKGEWTYQMSYKGKKIYEKKFYIR
jgi:hypothetical protein